MSSSKSSSERKELRDLVAEVERFIVAVDHVMTGPHLQPMTAKQRELAIGKLVTRLEIAKDCARRYGLNASIKNRRGKVSKGGLTALRIAQHRLARVEGWIRRMRKRTGWPINLQSLASEGLLMLRDETGAVPKK